MQDGIPKYLDARQLANAESELEWVLNPSLFKRLADSVASIDQPVSTLLRFENAANKAIVLRMSLSTRVSMPCQRCLEAVDCAIEAERAFQFVRHEEDLANVAVEFDGMQLEKEGVLILDLIEDELILSLPSVAMHDGEQLKYCKPLAFEANPSDEEVAAASPFAELLNLPKEK